MRNSSVRYHESLRFNFRFQITAIKDPKHACRDFRCQGNGFCIHPELLCDGVNHCSDGSDESVNAKCQSKSSVTACQGLVIDSSYRAFFRSNGKSDIWHGAYVDCAHNGLQSAYYFRLSRWCRDLCLQTKSHQQSRQR